MGLSVFESFFCIIVAFTVTVLAADISSLTATTAQIYLHLSIMCNTSIVLLYSLRVRHMHPVEWAVYRSA